ncbi:MAG: MATE family efflux transporter, partial [Parvularculaceae bacterium]
AALDRARVPLLIICAMPVQNAALTYLLIFGSFGFPRLELVGAGVASTISNAAAFAALGLYASRERAARAFEVFRDFATPHWRRLRAVLALGLPISITTAFEGMLFNGSVLLVGLIGATEVAAFQIALNVSSLAFMAPLGISFAGAVRVGLHAGAGDLDGVRRAAALTIVFAVVAISFVAAPVAAAPRAITALYLDASDAANRELMALAATFLPIAAGFMLTDAVQVAANQSLRGLKDVRAPMVITGVCYWIVGFPFAAWLSQATPAGAAGVWWGILVGISSAALALSWRLRSLVRPRAAPAAPQTA